MFSFFWETHLVSRDQFYGFLCVERNNGAPPSRLKGIFESIVFVRHVLGVVEFQSLIESRRCLGACGNDPFHIIKQANPLTVKQLVILHGVLANDLEDWNRLFAGMVLFCVYARSRWSDAQHAEELIYDESSTGALAYIEASVAVHKTARAMNLRHQFLPLVAPAVGVTSDNWVTQWQQVRDKLGLMLVVHPLMPAPDEDYRPKLLVEIKHRGNTSRFWSWSSWIWSMLQQLVSQFIDVCLLPDEM